MPAIHQHRQLDLARASQVNQPVHGGPDRPAGEEDVVHQDHLEVCDVERDVGLTQHRVLFPRVEIVTIEGDVQLPDGDRRPFDLLELFGEPFGEVHAAGPNAHQGHLDDRVVLRGDLVRHAGQGPVDFLGVHDRAGGLLHFHTVTLNKVKGLMGIKKPSGKPPPEGNGSRLCRSATTCAMSDSFPASQDRSEEHTSELQSQSNLVCRLLLEKKKKKKTQHTYYTYKQHSKKNTRTTYRQ